MPIDPFTVGSIISAGGSLVSNLLGNSLSGKAAAQLARDQIKAQQDMNNRNIAFQEAANAANIASQEKINQQQLDYSKQINDLMRHDAKHAISDKRQDLMRGGYSTADPSLSGFSAASLSSPALAAPHVTAPQVESEFTPQMASTLIDSKNSTISRTTQLASTIADIALKRAQTINTDENTKSLVKSNAWIDLEKDASYSLMLQNIDNAFKDGQIKQKQADMLANELSTFKTRFDLLQEELSSAKTHNKYLDERLSTDISEVLTRITNIKADTDNKNIQKSLLGIDKDLKELEYKYAKMGINFHASDLFSSIARIAVSGTGPEILDSVMTSIDQMIGTFVEGIANGAVTLGNNIVDGVVNTGKKIVDKFLP